MKEFFVFKRYLYDVAKALKPKQAKEFLYAVVMYEFEGVLPNFNGIMDGIFKQYIQNTKIKEIGKKEQHWNWKGGVSSENRLQRSSSEYLRWRREVLTRDLFTCQICGKQSTNLEAHHIKKFSEYPELRLEVENGVTLCKRCHRQLHKEDKCDE